MSKNPFTSVGDVTRKIGKNYYDWSHDYNFTGKIGTIYPVFAKYCPAGQSLSIDAVAGLQFMPMQFPVQSKMKMKLSFWRMPLRAMWKDYTNLVSSQNQSDVQKDYVAPYIDFNHSGAYTDMLAVGGLCDYLRIPVVNSSIFYNLPVTLHSQGFKKSWIQTNSNYNTDNISLNLQLGYLPADAQLASCTDFSLLRSFILRTDFSRSSLPVSISPTNLTFSFKLSFSDVGRRDSFLDCLHQVELVNKVGMKIFLTDPSQGSGKNFTPKVLMNVYSSNFVKEDDKTLSYKVLPSSVEGSFVQSQFTSPVLSLCLAVNSSEAIFSGGSGSYEPYFYLSDASFGSDVSAPISKETSPYFDSSSSKSAQQLKLSAYPFRMYEAIYNSYIRYIRNNPFKKDGKAVYNEWLPTMEGGADKTPYKLHRCNWAADAYTTAVQSPQQGVAPVVGLSQATVVGDDGLSRVVPAITTEDGKSYGIEFRANEFGLDGVDYTELGTGAKVAPVHSMYGLAQSGISIEDFRMTNAYQRYLELNMMRGYSYKQIVEGRFEVNVKYDDLLMPEFCGGMTRDVFMSGVQQNVEDNNGSGTYIGSLGSEAGVAGCRGDLGHKVKIYCDEPSYVMALAYVVPQSIYSQVCPKDFLYRDLLDAWSPEFDQIGFQPIKFSELAPVQAWQKGPDKLSQTFGFQRPWYEYCEVPDASVGLFNTELRNFLMHRVFSSIPVLGQDFTTVNPESVDHVFSVTEFTDKFFGQIHFSIDVKSPVSRVVIPSLE